VDAETADGSVKVLVVGSGELPPRNHLETPAFPLLFGNRLDVKVINGDTSRSAGAPPTIGHGIENENIIKCATFQAAATQWEGYRLSRSTAEDVMHAELQILD
jgi:hypothetical protein